MKKYFVGGLVILGVFKLFVSLAQALADDFEERKLEELDLRVKKAKILKAKLLTIDQIRANKDEIQKLKSIRGQECNCQPIFDLCNHWHQWRDEAWAKWLKQNGLSQSIRQPLALALKRDCNDRNPTAVANACEIKTRENDPPNEICKQVANQKHCHFIVEGVRTSLTRDEYTEAQGSLANLSDSVYKCLHKETLVEIDDHIKALTEANLGLKERLREFDTQLSELNAQIKEVEGQ